MDYRNCTSYENFKLKLCTCAKRHALGTHTKFHVEILTINVISGIVYFCEIILKSLWNVGEMTSIFQVCLEFQAWISKCTIIVLLVLHQQVISTHGINYLDLSSCLMWGRISAICVMSVWRNFINCRYLLMFPRKNSANKGLRVSMDF